MHNIRTRRTLATLFLLLWLAAAAPFRLAAAPAEGITPLFLGSLQNSDTSVPTAADGLFTALAAQASASIDIALYDFDRVSVRDALLAAKARGVAVRVVGDDEDGDLPSYAPFYGALSNAGIPLVTDRNTNGTTNSALMHNKFAVFDGSVTWTGSANFSDNAFVRNGENALVITSTVVADIYTTEFNEMFGGKFHTKKTDNTPHSATVAGSALEIAFAPTDGVEARMIAALASADTSIQVAMFTFTSAPLAQALIDAHARGVRVDVLLDGTADGSQFSQRDPLCAAGVVLRVEGWKSKLHDKYAVIDAGTDSDPQIITGSTNWTNNAVTANDENMLIAHDAALASAYADDFARLSRQTITQPSQFSCNADIFIPVATAGTPPSVGQAAIIAIDGNPPVSLDESVLIQNTGSAALDMTGYTLRDVASLPNIYTFPAFTLAPGAEVRVWVKIGTDDEANLFWNRSSAVWNNGGDTAILSDATGSEVSRLTYP